MPAARAQALDCELSFTTGGDGGATWDTEDWMPYYGPDMAAGGNIGADEQVWMQTSVSVSDGEKMSFYWKVSSEEGGDYLKFYINDVLQHQISGNVDWQKKSYTFSGSGTKTLKWVYSRDSSGEAGQNCGWVDGLVIGSGSLVGQPDAMSEALDCDLKFTSTADDDDLWYAYSGTVVKYYLNGDSARTDETLADNSESCLQTIVESDSAETVKFYWKVSSEQGGDYLQFYIDSTLKDQISGEVGWQQKSYSVTAGTHILKWRYVKDSGDESGDDCGWVDFVQWSGPSPAQDPADWQQIAYKHDVGGRRVEKRLVVSSSNPSDGYSTRYLYDGPHVIAEYDGNNNLLRKYIFGPGIDQPVSMIEVADANATYYYHFDALGSVVALSDAAGDTVQTYEYSVYGEVAVEDANHPNPYMFAGVRYDIEIGLYYNRARYYNPFTGRFLQTDPIGYKDGMNMYAYCGNNPVGRADPSGLYYGFSETVDNKLMWGWFDPTTGIFELIGKYNSIDKWCEDTEANRFTKGSRPTVGWALSEHFVADETHSRQWFYEKLQFLFYLQADAGAIDYLDRHHTRGDVTISIKTIAVGGSSTLNGVVSWNTNAWTLADNPNHWNYVGDPVVVLVHELTQTRGYFDLENEEYPGERAAMCAENLARWKLFTKVPGKQDVWPRPGYWATYGDVGLTWWNKSWWGPDNAWEEYWNHPETYPIDD